MFTQLGGHLVSDKKAKNTDFDGLLIISILNY